MRSLWFVAMFRLLARALQNPSITIQNGLSLKPATTIINRIDISKFSTLQVANTTSPKLLALPKVQEISNSITRNLVKFSWGKGKRKTCSAVLKRFYRLSWGGWIHTKCGRNKKIWKKHAARKRRLRQHVLCNASQSHLLDKMVNNFWRKPKYWVDDPYEPYHSREEFVTTYKKPRAYIPLR